jgi:hypothetical protein
MTRAADPVVAGADAGSYFSMMSDETKPALSPAPDASPEPIGPLPPEVGGAKGPEPTRYGDWEHKGRCTDF